MFGSKEFLPKIQFSSSHLHSPLGPQEMTYYLQWSVIVTVYLYPPHNWSLMAKSGRATGCRWLQMAAMSFVSMSDTSQFDPQLLAAKRAMREVPATLRQKSLPTSQCEEVAQNLVNLPSLYAYPKQVYAS